MKRGFLLFQKSKGNKTGQGPVSLRTWNKNDFNILILFRAACLDQRQLPDYKEANPCILVSYKLHLCARSALVEQYFSSHCKTKRYPPTPPMQLMLCGLIMCAFPTPLVQWCVYTWQT